MAVPPSRRAISIVEAAFATLVVGVVVVAALGAVGGSVAAQGALYVRGRGQMLALDLMGEVMQQAFSEPTEASVFGPESTETTGTRANFDDVDDYHNLVDAPPSYKDGAPIPDFDDWSRSVIVDKPSANNLVGVSGPDSGIRRITITVDYKGRLVTTLTAVRAYKSPEASSTQ